MGAKKNWAYTKKLIVKQVEKSLEPVDLAVYSTVACR